MDTHPLWFLCLTTRLCMIYAFYCLLRSERKIKYAKARRIIILSTLFIIGLGFLNKAYFGSNNEIQVAKVFWHETRYVHGVLYLLSGFYLLFDNLNMCLLLLGLDVLFSIMYRIILSK